MSTEQPREKALVIYDFGHVNGGAAQVAIDQALRLTERGLDVTYLFAVGPADQRLADGGVRLIDLGQQDPVSAPTIRAALSTVFNGRALRMLSGLLKRERFDLIVVHGWSKRLSAAIFLPLWFARARAAIWLHDYFLVCPNGGLFDYRRREICPIAPLSAGCLAKNCDKRSYAQKIWRYARTALQRAILAPVLDRFDFVCVSEFQKSVLERSAGIPKRLHVVENRIPPAARPRVAAEDNQVFVFIGRPSPEKGLAEIVRTFSGLSAPLQVVGTSPEEFDGAIPPNVMLLGWKTAAEIRSVLSQARALIFPSLWYEAAPLVPREAMSLGIPVVALNTNAATAYIAHGENGLIVHDLEQDLVRAVEKLRDDGYVRRLSRNAFARAPIWSEEPSFGVDWLLSARR